MEIFYDLSQKNKNLALALGFFDGVHLGHQQVIKSAVNYARQFGVKSAVITFKEHPQVVLRGAVPLYISSAESKYEKFAALGVDYCYELDFTKVCQYSGEDYVRHFLIDNFSPVSVSTGFNHYFGVGKSGSAQLLRDLSATFGYKYFMISPVMLQGEIVSSSQIRKKIKDAQLEVVAKMLGEKFSICGVVQKGAGLGRRIGFKTANVVYPETRIKLPNGVYSVEIVHGGQTFKGVANLGIKPTFEDLVDAPLLEVHILDFASDIYGEMIEIKFVKFIREEKKFANAQELIKQIERDLIQVNKAL